MDADRELADLRHHWHGAYSFSYLAGWWLASRADTGAVLRARTADGLRRKVRRDYAANPVPREP